MIVSHLKQIRTPPKVDTNANDNYVDDIEEENGDAINEEQGDCNDYEEESDKNNEDKFTNNGWF